MKAEIVCCGGLNTHCVNELLLEANQAALQDLSVYHIIAPLLTLE